MFELIDMEKECNDIDVNWAEMKPEVVNASKSNGRKL